MIKYIALLRGINVGGKNKICMSGLKAAFTDGGFINVSTYINSGNVFFESGLSADAVRTACENAVHKRFGIKITVGVFTAAEISEAVNNAPEWWNSGVGVKHNAIFVIPPMTAQKACALVGEARPEYEKIACRGKVIFWTASLAAFNKTRWAKVVEKKEVYNLITIRNANTALKLAKTAERISVPPSGFGVPGRT